MTAEERGQEMMLIPMDKLPEIAIEFAKKLSNEVGFCAEVLLTSWTVYAQCVEGLPCTDPLYKASGRDKKWFEENIKRSMSCTQ